MKENMKVAVMLDKMKMGWEERPIPAPADNEVLVKIDCVGIADPICIIMKMEESEDIS